ncbi:lysine--tRNA ligase [Halococcus sp. AFM35]|uniref:lysine--tRNA ligase n=1 Tax=Halococcus sp. AFM35 TaxID=3421653 RepID=UPI003EC06961
MTEEDPYTLGEGDHHAFWADEVADRIEARRERIGSDGPVVIKGGVSPSGVPHLGHANELMRGYFVAEVLRERGHEVRQVFTSDDRDPLRKIPRTLADREWNVMDLGDVPNPGVLGRNLGKPLTDIPDPFECCDSFGDHQTHLLESMTEQLGIDVGIRSTTALYETGEFDDVTRELLDEHEHAHELLGEYQASVRDADEYVPFNPICAECGKLTETVTAIDGERVAYRCTDFEAGNQLIEGCGHEGTATVREGKLPWRFEWPAQWRVLTVDFEPFGKDHAEGSWPSGEAIAQELLDFAPPTPMVYEWFTLNGEPLSSSSGHIITVAELLDLLEREVLHYYFTKNPARARDFDVSQLDQLVDEFDRFEGLAFGVSTTGSDEKIEEERAHAERVYPLVVDEVSDEQPIRIPYTFAAVLGMTDDRELRERMARREGHILEGASESAVESALERVNRARRWAERTDNAYNYRLATDLPDVGFEGDTEAALDELAAFVAAGHGGEEIQSEIFETARAHDLDPGDLFTAGYRLFFDTEQGPKLGPFLAELDREFVVRRLRREG